MNLLAKVDWNMKRVLFGILGGATLWIAAGIGWAEESAPEPEEPIFPDKNLEAVVRQSVYAKRNNDEPITESDVLNVSTVKGRGKGIRDLTGLEKCRSLALLDLAGNQITDISPVTDLPRLQSLDLSDNAISDVSPLATLPALQYIELSDNQVSDLKPLSSLTNLSALYLGYNRIQYIYPILNLPKLASLHLSVNEIESIEGIGSLKWLSSLSLDGNKIFNLYPLEELKNLNFLDLQYNRVSDIGPLISAVKTDYEGEKRFAPFLRFYVRGNRIPRGQLEKIKEYGVRVFR